MAASVTGPPNLQGLVQLGTRQPLYAYLAELWQRRAFIAGLSRGQLRSQHLDTVLGSTWHVVNPLLLVGVYYLIFGLLFERTDERLTAAGVSYMAFLAIGVFTFNYMQRCVSAGASSVVSNRGLINTLHFPRAVLPIAAVTKESLAFVPAVLVMVTTVLLAGQRPAWPWLLFLPVAAAMTAFGLGGALVAARLAEQLPDVKNVLPFAFRLVFYASGVLFDVRRITESRPGLESLSEIFLYNPFYVFITLSRAALIGQTGDTPMGWLCLSAACWTIGLLMLGIWYFRRAENRYGRD